MPVRMTDDQPVAGYRLFPKDKSLTPDSIGFSTSGTENDVVACIVEIDKN